MLLKSKIDVLGQDIFIKFRKNLVIEEKDNNEELKKDKCDGAFIPDSNTIYLDDNLKNTPTKLCEVFIHELLECILCLLEIDLQHPSITQISTVLYGTLRRNRIIKPIDYESIPIEEDGGPV